MAVVLMMAVLTGSLMLGDSVRDTLVGRVNERLGQTETIIASGIGFMDEELLQHPLMEHAEGYLLAEGFVSANDKLVPVYVWGTSSDSIPYGEALINEPLQKKLPLLEDMVLHLPSHNLVPSGSLFVTQGYATQMRLHVAGVKGVEEGGNLLLKNEQTLPLNVFVSRQQLAEVMELENKINLILSAQTITEEQLEEAWKPTYSGLHQTDTSLTYDGIFIPHEIVDHYQEESKEAVSSYFSYLVNDIIHASDTVPYSFVTAVDRWQGTPLTGHDIILSDYASERLGVEVGDSVRMSYFVAHDLKNLETKEQWFRVCQVVPLSALVQDSLIQTEFPGLSHVEKCTDWDSDLPIKMDRVHKVDEDFWYAYRQAPKALVSYEAVKADWANAYGSATALHFKTPPHAHLSSHDVGILLFHPREEGLDAASQGVDFASLFLALGFFIILSAILLMQNPLFEMFTQRQGEVLLYLQMGFSRRQVERLLFRESFGVMLMASPFGIVAGMLYSALTLWLLGNVWSGATHTEGFALHIHLLTLILSWLIGLLLCIFSLWWVLHRQVKTNGICRSAFVTKHPSWWPSLLCLAITLTLIVYNFLCLHSMMLFILCGLLWIVTFGIFLRTFISRKGYIDGNWGWTRTRWMWQSVCASLKQHLLAYWTLSMGVFTVFSVGLCRPNFSDAEMFEEATGGYQLYVDCRVPVQYDLNLEEVRHKLTLQDLPDSTSFLSFLRHAQDEASCLNLNKVTTPTVLGVDLQCMGTFGLDTVPETPGTDNRMSSHGTSHIPRLYVDQESLIWSLMRSVGDTLFYQNGSGKEVPVVIAGTYPTGIFHGNAILSKEDFRLLWPKESGIGVLLVKSPQPELAGEILATAMSEYGLNIQTVEERIKMFFEVTETYLIIFLTLGGLGLVLGIFSLIILVRKNLTAQHAAILQYRAMGFSEVTIRDALLRENLIVPFFAIGVGAFGSLISISANVGGAGLITILVALACLLVLYLLLYFGIKRIIRFALSTVNNS